MNTSLKNETKKPLLVGITGGIGSGKSTVSKIVESLDVPVFYADMEAKIIINTDKEIIAAIKQQFGEVYVDGKLNNEKMAQIVFNDKNALEQLNKIVHPKVRQQFNFWVEQHRDFPILMEEAAILIESGAYQNIDKIILVVASIEDRILRVIKRDHVPLDKVEARIKAQITDEEKLKYADYCIQNDGKHLIVPQVLEIYNKLKSLN